MQNFLIILTILVGILGIAVYWLALEVVRLRKEARRLAIQQDEIDALVSCLDDHLYNSGDDYVR